MKYHQVQQFVVRCNIKQIPYFTTHFDAYLENPENFTIIEYVTTYMLIVEDALKNTVNNKVQNVLLDVYPYSREEVRHLSSYFKRMAGSPCVYLNRLSSTCLEHVEKYEHLL